MDISQIKEEHAAAVEHLNLAIMSVPPDNVLVRATMSGNLAKEMKRFASKQERVLFHIAQAQKKMANATQTALLCAALFAAHEGQREFFKAS